MKDQKLWQLIKSLEEGSDKEIKEAGEAKATMIVNFGPDGKTKSGLIDGDETLTQMLLKSFGFYVKALQQVNTLDQKGLCPNCNIPFNQHNIACPVSDCETPSGK